VDIIQLTRHPPCSTRSEHRIRQLSRGPWRTAERAGVPINPRACLRRIASQTMQPTFMTPFRVLWRRGQLERACRWTRSELEHRQERRLSALRRFAMERSPFYQRFHRGLEHQPLQALPILTKAVMMESFDNLVTDRTVRLSDAEAFLRENRGGDLFRQRYVVLATSGSTGRRGLFLFDSQEWLTALAMITRPMAWAGLSRGLKKPPRSAMVASTTPWHYSTRISASLSSRLLPALRLDAAEPLSTMVRRLNEWQPEVLAVYPSVLKQLADEQIAGNLQIPLRSVATSAEVLEEETRRRVRQAWGLRVFDTYGATEYAPIAAECAHGRKHLFEDGAIIEVVDDRGRAVPAGARGDRLLLTIFNRRTQPLIRYEISDMVRPLGGECECGRKFRLIESIEGRVEDILYFPHRDGRDERVAAHPNLFHQVLETVPASGWQVQQDDDGLSVSLAGLQDQSVCHALAVSLRQILEGQGAAIGPIRVRAVDVLERGATGKAPLILARKVAAPPLDNRDRRAILRPL
jgi:phenylacetate-CoA ligase